MVGAHGLPGLERRVTGCAVTQLGLVLRQDACAHFIIKVGETAFERSE